MTHIHTTPETIQSLKALGTVITMANGEEWIYYPHWMKQAGPDTVELVSFEHLPEDVKAAIGIGRWGG